VQQDAVDLSVYLCLRLSMRMFMHIRMKMDVYLYVKVYVSGCVEWRHNCFKVGSGVVFCLFLCPFMHMFMRIRICMCVWICLCRCM